MDEKSTWLGMIVSITLESDRERKLTDIEPVGEVSVFYILYFLFLRACGFSIKEDSDFYRFYTRPRIGRDKRTINWSARKARDNKGGTNE